MILGVWATLALAADCEGVAMTDLLELQTPAVIVLGERPGTFVDERRAERIVFRLAEDEPVTLALEAVEGGFQSVLDDYADGRIDPSDVPPLVRWDESWPYAWSAYQPLVTAAVMGVEVIAAGLPHTSMPRGESVTLPPRYMDVIEPRLADQGLPLAYESRFVQAMAWRDRRIAEQALEGWNGKGYLIVLAHRMHVAGGRGVAWQLAQRTQAPVESVLLGRAGASCEPGDRVLRTLFGG